MTGGIEAVFGQAGCTGTLCVQSLDDGAETGLAPNRAIGTATAQADTILREPGAQLAGGVPAGS